MNGDGNPRNDPARNWNPVDNFWRLVYPLFNPRPGSSPVRLDPPSPIWDLPSPHNRYNTGVMHPDERNAIPHYVVPDYFYKLATLPSFPVISMDPSVWMVVPFWTATGPAFAFVVNRIKGLRPFPSPWSLFTTTIVGASLGICKAMMQSENRLQGYHPNEEDVAYWRERAIYERKVASGEIDERLTGSLSEQTIKKMFGPKVFNLEELEKEYLSGKDA